MVQPSDRSGGSAGADDRGTWIGEGDPPEDFAPVAPSPDTASGMSRDRRLLLGLGGLVLAWLAVVGLGRLAAPDEIAEAPAPTAAPLVQDAAPTATPVPSAPPTPELEVPAEDVDVAQLGARMGSSVQVERMVRQLGRRGSDALLAYRSAQGIVLVDLAAGTADIVEPTADPAGYAPEFVVVRTDDTHDIDLGPGDVLLRAAGQTVAIDRADLDVRLIADDSSLIVTQTRNDESYWVPGRDLQGQAAEVIGLADGRAEWFRAPHAVQLIVKDGLGLLAVSKAGDGETMIADAGEFVPLFDDPVLDANANAALLRACSATPCVYRVAEFDAPTTWIVPSDFIGHSDRFVLAPHGEALLRYTEHGFAEIYDNRDQSVSWVTGASMHDAAWGPDSSFVAWIDLLGAPEIRVMFIDERDWLRIDLDDMGLPRPIGTELVVFDQPADEPETS